MTSNLNPKYNIIQPLLLASVMAIGIMIGFKIKDNHHRIDLIEKLDSSYGYHQTGRVEELLRFIDHKYVDSIDMDTLLDDAIFALIDNLDPHSEYLTPNEVEDIQHQMEGQFRGIGIETIMIRDTATIYKVLDVSPAKKAGILPGDKIIRIDTFLVAGNAKPFSEIRQHMKKPKGEFMLLELQRMGKKHSIKIKVEDIAIPSVPCGYLVNDSLIYVRIERFGSNTYKDFMNVIEQNFGEAKSKNLVIDLRGNPGGYLPEATNILSQIFEDKNKILVTTKTKNNQISEYKSTGKRFFNIQHLAIVVDEHSASASEIIAGAIQDWDRGTIFGRRTYGKGLVQEQYDLSNGGAIRLTVAKYFTPSGRSIQRSYKDKFEYESDLLLRATNGDYFKSNTQVFSSDTSKHYYSLVKKRELLAGGGINPDVFVPLDSMLFKEKYKDLESKLIEYYLDHFRKNAYKDYTTFEKIKSFSLSTKDFDHFLSESKLPLPPEDKKKMFLTVSKLFKMVMANCWLSTLQNQQLINHLDDEIIQAVDFLNAKK
ncbi:MAG: S41 family peptidase [Saprospiraceae bacterium]